MPELPSEPTFGLMDSPRKASSDAEASAATNSDVAECTRQELNLAGILAPASSPDEIGWLAHYRVLKVVGHGGMGAVFQAEDTQLQRVVALKVILPQHAGTSLARDRFLREARACAALKSDHIVTIYQVGQDRDIPFLAMEYLQGQTLDDRLKEHGPVSPSEALRIGRETAAGLATAHAQGLIHRDIKPANVWLEAPNGRVKLLDFGLARAAGSSGGITQTGSIVGTPEFMSPEQARGEQLGTPTDLFSFGAVLYAMCAGHNPFQGSSVMAILTALAVDTPRPLGEIRNDVPPKLAQLISRLLEKKSVNRPASAVEVAAELAAIEADARDSGTFVGIQCGAGNTTIPTPPTAATTARRSPRRAALLAAASVGLIGLLGAWLYFRSPGEKTATAPVFSEPPIRIGVLHSLRGTMQISELPVVDAVLLAVDEINANGGVLGRRVECVIADGESDENDFAKEAENLIATEQVCAIFGCWTSACRKAVVPVVERHNHLLFYPVQYEGLEQSPNVVYLGLVPNQQIVPALRWFVGFERKSRWFLVGSDYVFPHAANAIIQDEAKASGCEIVGEQYIPFGGTNVAAVIQKIVEAKPDLIVNTINGDTNVAFFRELRLAGIKSTQTPTISFSVTDAELSALRAKNTAGDYAAASYFHSLDSPENLAFLKRFAHRYDPKRIVSDAMLTAYAGVHLWANTVKAAGSEDPKAIRERIKGRSIDTPQGLLKICPITQHTIQFARIGKIDETGRLVQVYRTEHPIDPKPFPTSRTREEWSALLEKLYKQWGGRWTNPGP